MTDERAPGPLGTGGMITDEEGGMFDIDALVREVMEHGAAGEAARRAAARRKAAPAAGCDIAGKPAPDV